MYIETSKEASKCFKLVANYFVAAQYINITVCWAISTSFSNIQTKTLWCGNYCIYWTALVRHKCIWQKHHAKQISALWGNIPISIQNKQECSLWYRGVVLCWLLMLEWWWWFSMKSIVSHHAMFESWAWFVTYASNIQQGQCDPNSWRSILNTILRDSFAWSVTI